MLVASTAVLIRKVQIRLSDQPPGVDAVSAQRSSVSAAAVQAYDVRELDNSQSGPVPEEDAPFGRVRAGEPGFNGPGILFCVPLGIPARCSVAVAVPRVGEDVQGLGGTASVVDVGKTFRDPVLLGNLPETFQNRRRILPQPSCRMIGPGAGRPDIPDRRNTGVGDGERLRVDQQRTRKNPGDQIRAVVCSENVVEGIRAFLPGQAEVPPQEAQFVIAQNRLGRLSVTLDPAKDREGIGPFVDEISYEDKTVGGRFEGNPVQQGLQRSEAAVNVSDDVRTHGAESLSDEAGNPSILA